jgi:hypothetical protein
MYMYLPGRAYFGPAVVDGDKRGMRAAGSVVTVVGCACDVCLYQGVSEGTAGAA